MKLRKTMGIALGLALAVGSTTIGSAVAAPKERREERREDRQDRREERKEERGERHEARKEDRGERREDRKEWRDRRRAARRAFIDKWGPLYKQPAVRAELELHARRLARLARMRALAVEAGKDKVVKAVDDIVEKENARFELRMTKLKGGAQ
jgi:hypothetical protein